MAAWPILGLDWVTCVMWPSNQTRLVQLGCQQAVLFSGNFLNLNLNLNLNLSISRHTNISVRKFESGGAIIQCLWMNWPTDNVCDGNFPRWGTRANSLRYTSLGMKGQMHRLYYYLCKIAPQVLVCTYFQADSRIIFWPIHSSTVSVLSSVYSVFHLMLHVFTPVFVVLPDIS